MTTNTLEAHEYREYTLHIEAGKSHAQALAAVRNGAQTRQNRPGRDEGVKAEPDTGAGQGRPQRGHKYGAKRITIDGHTFPSLAEGRRYEELKLMQQQGHIKHLTLQPRYQIRIDGVLITTYVADFRYQDVETGETVVEDVKGFKTPVYKLKRKLMQVVNGIEIQEIQA